MLIRPATQADWSAIWSFMREIVAAGETFAWDPDTSEEAARGYWMREPPARAFVAVADDGTVVGTAEMGPNHGGPGAHIASAGFMVDPRHEGQGVDACSASACASRPAPTATWRSSSTRSRRATPARSACGAHSASRCSP